MPQITRRAYLQAIVDSGVMTKFRWTVGFSADDAGIGHLESKSIIAMSEIKKAGIPTFCVAARATAGGTYASSFFMHDFIIIESNVIPIT